MRIITWILHCYPRRWRERYQEEMLALLEQYTITFKTMLDLLLGMLDARLNSVYRTKEGSMLQHIRDNRALSIIYLCSVAMFLITINFWMLVTTSFARDPLFSLAYNGMFFIPIISLIVLLAITCTTIGKAVNKRQWGTLIFAVICLGTTICLFLQAPSVYHLDLASILDWFSNSFYLSLLLNVLELTLSFGCGLFVTGIYGLKLLRKRQGWPLLFAVLIATLPLASYIPFVSQSFNNAPITSTLAFVCLIIASYLPLSAFLLRLTNGDLSRRGWQTSRIVGSLWGLFLLFTLVIAILWSVEHLMVDGGISLLNPVIMTTLTLIITLFVALLALARSFLIQPEGEGEIKAASAEVSGTQP